jgi:hypothetical protein
MTITIPDDELGVRLASKGRFYPTAIYHLSEARGTIGWLLHQRPAEADAGPVVRRPAGRSKAVAGTEVSNDSDILVGRQSPQG